MKTVLEAKNKRGQLGGTFNFVLGLVLVAVLVGAGLLALGKFKDSMTANSAEANATRDAIGAIDDISVTWLAVIVAVGMAGLIITILVNSFGGGKRR